MRKFKANQVQLSIVIPAYREEKRIGKTLDQLAAYLETEEFLRGKNVEVILVSADSPDKTHQVVKAKQKLFANLILIAPGPKVGKGRDVKEGVLKARGNAVLFMDADLATPLRHIKEFYQAYQQGDEVIIATRYFRRYRHSSARIALSALGNILFRIAGGVWVEDSQCGFKMFSNKAAFVCFRQLRILGWGFDMEILAIAKANGFSIKTARVNDWKAMQGGSFEDEVLMNSIHSLSDLFSIFVRRLSGTYKIKGSVNM